MNQEIKKQWVEALRSGKYQQGRETLRTKDNKFCCLGVLCDLVAPDAWQTDGDSEYMMGGIYGYLPNAVAHVSGLSSPTYIQLIELNDEKGYSFEMIANWIEYQL